ncbi:TPA: hypothetical protein ACPQXF_000923 [Streptococcus mutans]|uniref:hypothetical protein n=1 Tax=Streptococcus mutans TaxID=1309 RepID=UPI0014550CA0|nr:hypothetical protein [Streptococcus mutans]MCB5113072.1 hypothetical protein [Streptococcus mutans]NLQ71136.1 hypothetical protein [Streptococcus mutans]
MLTLVKRIFKDNIGIFVYVYLIQIVLRILKSLVDDAVILKTVYGLWIMIVATLLVFYSTYNLYRLVYTRQNFFYYTLKYSLSQVLLVAASVQLVLNFVFYLTYCEANLTEVGGKFLSLASYFMLVTLLLYVTRAFKYKKIGRNVFLLSLVFLLGSYATFYYNVIKDRVGDRAFGIGFTTDSVKDGIDHVYMNIIPTYLVNIKEQDLNFLMTTTNVINVFIITVGLLMYIAIRKIKINW